MVSLAFVFSTAFGSAALAAPGDVDPAFGNGGTAIVQTASTGDSLMNQAVATADGGTLTAGGIKDGAGLLVKRTAAGVLDPAFGSGGIASVPGAAWQRLTLMADGRIVTFGRVGIEAAVGRFMPDGTPDPTFGTGGIALPDIRSRFNGSNQSTLTFIGAGIDSQGRPVAVSNVDGCDLDDSDKHCDDLALVRLTPGGQIDTTFGGGDGVFAMRTSTKSQGVEPVVAVIGPDDTIAVAGTYYYEGDDYSPQYSAVNIGRYNADGTRQLAFGGEGIVGREVNRAPSINLFEIDGSGQVTVSVGSDVLRFRTDGKLDGSFGTKGRIALSRTSILKTSGVSSISIDSAAFDTDGRLYMGGLYLTGRPTEDRRQKASVIAVRFTPGGNLDPTFSGDGLNRVLIGQGQYLDEYGYDTRGVRGTEAIPGPDGQVTILATTLIDDQQRLTATGFVGGTPPVPECDGTPATVMGTEGPDEIVAGDVTFTGAGKDRIEQASGLICSGAGRDTITGDGTATIFAGAGNDLIDVKDNAGTIHGEAGNDEVITEGASVTVFGDDGDDRITAVGAASSDTFFGGPGKDFLDGSWGEDSLDGGPGPDRLIGSRADDRMYGRGGNDILSGGTGTDRLIGGPGKDQLDAGPRGPYQRWYRGRTPDGPIFLKVEKGRFVFSQMKVKTTCDDGDSYAYDEGSGFGYAKFRGSKGKFFYDGSYTDPIDSSEAVETLKGKLTAGKVTGRYRSTYDQFRGSKCWTGKGFRNAWIDFTAKRRPDPVQVVRQGGR